MFCRNYDLSLFEGDLCKPLKVNRLKLHDFEQFILKQSKNRTKDTFSHLKSFIYHTKTDAKVTTKPKLLDTREKALVALATISVTISSPGLLY